MSVVHICVLQFPHLLLLFLPFFAVSFVTWASYFYFIGISYKSMRVGKM